MALYDISTEVLDPYKDNNYTITVANAYFLAKNGSEGYNLFGEKTLCLIDPIVNQDTGEFSRIIKELDDGCSNLILKNNTQLYDTRGSADVESACDAVLSIGFTQFATHFDSESERETAIDEFKSAFHHLETVSPAEAKDNVLAVSSLAWSSTYLELYNEENSPLAQLGICGIELIRASYRNDQNAWDEMITNINNNSAFK